MPSAKKIFAKKINERFSKKQNEMQREPGIMGGGDNTLKVAGLSNFIYVTLNDKTVPVYNVRVAPKLGVKVWVGYSPEEPNLFQVLSTRSDTPAGGQVVGGGYAPSAYYEWMRKGGGQDPLHVHLRAFSPLKIGVSSAGGLNIELYYGVVYSGTTFIRVLKQDLDMTSYIPSTADKCKLVLVSIDDTGTAVITAGTEFDQTAYDPETSITTELPAIPADTVFVCGAVRVYTGQTTFRETHTNTDFIDLRFSGLSGGTITPSVSDHALLSNLNSTSYYHLTQAQYADLTDGGATTLHTHAGSTIPIVTTDPGSPADGELWLLRETTGAIPDGTPIGLLLGLTYTSNSGSVAPLQLSVNDSGTTRRLQFV